MPDSHKSNVTGDTAYARQGFLSSKSFYIGNIATYAERLNALSLKFAFNNKL